MKCYVCDRPIGKASPSIVTCANCGEAADLVLVLRLESLARVLQLVAEMVDDGQRVDAGVLARQLLYVYFDLPKAIAAGKVDDDDGATNG